MLRVIVNKRLIHFQSQVQLALLGTKVWIMAEQARPTTTSCAIGINIHNAPDVATYVLFFIHTFTWPNLSDPG